MFAGGLPTAFRTITMAWIVSLVACAKGVELVSTSEPPIDVEPDAESSDVNGGADEEPDAVVEDSRDDDAATAPSSADPPDAGQLSQDTAVADDASVMDAASDGDSHPASNSSTDAGLADASAPYSCPSCMLKVQWNSSTTSDSTPAISGLLKLSNTASVAIPLSDVTLRYWLRDPSAESMVIECYYWDDGVGGNKCVRPADAGVNVYSQMNVRIGSGAGDLRFVELSFPASAGQLSAAGAAPGAMQISLHLPNFPPMIQSDDPSFDSALTATSSSTLFDAPKISAYLGGQLAWGTEP